MQLIVDTYYRPNADLSQRASLQAGNSDLLRLPLPVGTAAADVRPTSMRAEASEWSIAIISIEVPGMSEGLARADALLWPAQAQGTAPPRDMYQPAAWISYGGGRWRAKTGLRDIDHAAASSRRRLRPRRLAGG